MTLNNSNITNNNNKVSSSSSSSSHQSGVQRGQSSASDEGSAAAAAATRRALLPAAVTHIADDLLKSFPHTKRVGNYLLGRTIGEGSFAKVKEGLHVVTGEQVICRNC